MSVTPALPRGTLIAASDASDLLYRFRHVAFDLSDAQPGDIGNLDVAVIVQSMSQEYLARSAGKSAHCSFDTTKQFSVDRPDLAGVAVLGRALERSSGTRNECRIALIFRV